MAEKGGKEPDAVKDLLYFIGFIVLLGILWAATGGYQRTVEKLVNPLATSGNSVISDANGGSSSGGAFSGQPATINFENGSLINNQSSGSSAGSSGTSAAPTYSDISSPERIDAPIPNKSPFFNQVVLEVGDVDTAPDQEYLVLSASDEIPYSINITGWTLRSLATGQQATIGPGEQLPFSDFISVSDETPIYLGPGQTALVTTGVSPIGGSFEENECTGYFNQYDTFSPTLDYDCPALASEALPRPPNALSNACLDYVATFPRCVDPNPDQLSAAMPYQCEQFIVDHESYGDCVQYHKPDADFYSNVWRIYLGRSAPLWQDEREVIELTDSSGKVVDEIAYNY